MNKIEIIKNCETPYYIQEVKHYKLHIYPHYPPQILIYPLYPLKIFQANTIEKCAELAEKWLRNPDK